MTADHVTEMLGDFEAFFGVQFTEQAAREYVEEFLNEDPILLAMAIKVLKDKNLRPSKERLREQVIKAREVRWQEHKDKEREWRPPKREPGRGVMREGLPLLFQFLAHGLSRSDFADKLEEMNRRYGMVGLAEAAKEIRSGGEDNERNNP